MATATEAPASHPAEGLTPHTHFRFETAAKEARPVRAVIDGPPGSGRTLAALRMAAELGDSIAVIDTERGRTRQYADQVPFHTTELTSFHPDALSLALYSAAGHDVVVINSWSAFWTGLDGHLDQVGKANAGQRGHANPNHGWNEMRPLERKMLESVMCWPGHVIGVLRDKVDVVLHTDAAGRQIPIRVALRPEQQAGIEYEVDFAATLLATGEIVVNKASAPGLGGEPLTDPAAIGKALRVWADEGTPRGPRPDMLQRAYYPDANYSDLSQLAQELSYHRAAGMPALDEHGDLTTLGEVVDRRCKYAYRREQAAARAAALNQPATEGSAA